MLTNKEIKKHIYNINYEFFFLILKDPSNTKFDFNNLKNIVIHQ